ncbi:MAG: protein translocase subunit SecF [Dehalococcoidia bacterium]|nr:protein translocase subunit SecF [Dehalococcoidia bacterium]
MIDFVGRKEWFSLISAVVVIVAIISLAVFELQPGIDFTGGTSMTLHFTPQVRQDQLRRELTNLGHPEVIVQKSGEDFLIRLKAIPPQERESFTEGLETSLGSEITARDYNTISPSIAAETARNAGIAVMIAAVAMLLYIAWAFRRMPNPFRWGICAIIALIHDVLIVTGVFSILGQIANVEINAMFITGLLAVVGYSVNNTVVVFDRIRENMAKGLSRDFAVVVNASLIETVARSLNTSLTTLCVVLALFLFGGATIHLFVSVLLIGLIAGTYSSLFVAGPLLVTWEKREWGQLFSWLPFVKTSA